MTCSDNKGLLNSIGLSILESLLVSGSMSPSFIMWSILHFGCPRPLCLCTQFPLLPSLHYQSHTISQAADDVTTITTEMFRVRQKPQIELWNFTPLRNFRLITTTKESVYNDLPRILTFFFLANNWSRNTKNEEHLSMWVPRSLATDRRTPFPFFRSGRLIDYAK